MLYHQTASAKLKAEYEAKIKLMARLVGGDVIGPGGVTANDLVSFDGVTGKVIKDSGILASDVDSAVSLKHTQGTDTSLGTQLEDLDMGGFAVNAVNEVRFNPKVSSSGAEGTMFYCSTDDSVYVATE